MIKLSMLTRYAPLTLCMILASPAHSAVLSVPSEFSSIQSAIDASIAGDVILVQPGIYFGRLNYLGKDIAVRSSSGPLVTIIDPLADTGPVVTFESGETELAILDGFTIRNGRNALESHLSPGLGGGIFIFGSSPRILNCRITANEANRGAGMSIDGTASPQIEDCVFSSNKAFTPTPNFTSGSGGGAYVTGSASGVFLRCTFTENVAGSGGGGISTDSVSASQIIDCEFTNNLAAGGGGISIRYSTGMSMISGSTFLNNIGRLLGGGIFSFANFSITDCMFANNSAGMDGGAIYTAISQGSTIESSTFLSNSTWSTGGAIYSYSDLSLSNCFFGNNSSDYGGAIYSDRQSSFVTDSIFSCNTANIGAAYFFWNSTGLVLGCTFRDNQPLSGFGGVLYTSVGAVVTIGSSDFCGLPTMELLSGPWIDDGGNTFSDDCSPALRADIDCNGLVNVSDLLLLLGAWGPCSQCPSDLNLDEVVNFIDLIWLLLSWKWR